MAREIIKWMPNYSVGSPLIDEQHKKLINLINKLYDAFLRNDHKDKILEIIEEMEEYTQFHFKTEEELFRKAGYSESTEHMKEHRDFEKKVVEFKEKYNKNKGALTYEVMSFLRNWLNNHILVTDKKYVEELKKLYEFTSK